MANLTPPSLSAEQWRERLHRAIPGGAHTYSRGDDQFPRNAPPILVRGKGAYVWDADGRQFLDYGMALRAVTLGYADDRVNRAAAEAMDLGVNLTRATWTELRAAETLIDMIPSVEMAKFAKNGSNVTTAAVKIARAFTRRRYVCIPRQQPFFSFDDWFIGTTSLKRGVPSEHAVNTLVFDYGDIASLRALFEQYPGEIAAVMLEPATSLIPCPRSCSGPAQWPQRSCAACPERGSNFLHQTQALCRASRALLIFDEMITGFRWSAGGAQEFFGVTPDLCTFGKGMANGHSVAAVGGRRDVMQVGSIDQPGMERTFLLSTTHGAEMTGLGAFIETARIYREEDVTGHLWAYGTKLKDGLNGVARARGVSRNFVVEGPAVALNYVVTETDGKPSMPLRTLFAQEMIRHGVLMPWIAVSQSHGATELDRTLEAADKALAVVARAVESGTDGLLLGPAIKPVFRSHN